MLRIEGGRPPPYAGKRTYDAPVLKRTMPGRGGGDGGAGNTGARCHEKPRGVRNEHGAWALRLVNGVGNEKMANAKNDSEFGKHCRLVVYCQPVLVCVYMCVRAYMCARACCICVCGGVRG